MFLTKDGGCDGFNSVTHCGPGKKWKIKTLHEGTTLATGLGTWMTPGFESKPNKSVNVWTPVCINGDSGGNEPDLQVPGRPTSWTPSCSGPPTQRLFTGRAWAGSTSRRLRSFSVCNQMLLMWCAGHQGRGILQTEWNNQESRFCCQLCLSNRLIQPCCYRERYKIWFRLSAIRFFNISNIRHWTLDLLKSFTFSYLH